MHGRAARQVDELGGADGVGDGGVERVGPGEQLEAAGRRAQRGEPLDAAVDQPPGVLVGRGGGQDEHLVGGRVVEQGAVEGARRGELGPADHREPAAHRGEPPVGPVERCSSGPAHCAACRTGYGAPGGRRAPRLRSWSAAVRPGRHASKLLRYAAARLDSEHAFALPSLPIGNLTAHDETSSAWASWAPGSWVPASPRWRPRPAIEVVLRSRKQDDGRRHGRRRSRSRSPSRSSGASSSEAERDADPRPGHGHRRPAATSPTATSSSSRSSRTSPSRRTLFAELDRIVQGRAPSSPPTPRPCRSSRWPWPPTAPTRSCGVHFFNPAPAMSLVEIVRPLTASDETIAAATRLRRRPAARTRSRSRTAPASSSTPCCSRTSTTRCGCSRTAPPRRDDIDAAMKGGCNFPMGPLALLDLVGLDTSRGHPRCALRRVPRPELRGRAAAAPHGRRRPARPQVAAPASTTTASSRCRHPPISAPLSASGDG